MNLILKYFSQVKLTLHQRDLQLESLQQEHLDLMKQFTVTQEMLHTKEQTLDDLQTQYDELKARLEEFQSDATSKDDMIQYLQNEKIVLEVALQTAKASQEQLDEGTKRLGEDTEVTSEILEQLRQEMAIKSSQVIPKSVCIKHSCCNSVLPQTRGVASYMAGDLYRQVHLCLWFQHSANWECFNNSVIFLCWKTDALYFVISLECLQFQTTWYLYGFMHFHYTRWEAEVN